jgi:curved DNA-binding protein CbpA
MTDYFALLDEPRRPWLDAGGLKEKFLALSAQAHPDRQHTAPDADRYAAGRQFSELNTAYNCLRDSRERIRHLLELECGARPKDIERVPQELLDYFAAVGGLCRNVDAFLAEKFQATSPILKVQLFERGLEWTAKINSLLRSIADCRETLEAELKTMNAAWESATPRDKQVLERLEAILRLLGYYGRWTAQLQERNAQLAI